METKLIRMDEKHIDAVFIREAGNIIKEGGLVAFPTETVYGLGGDALNPLSSDKIYRAKGRPSDNPLIVHIVDMDDLGSGDVEIGLESTIVDLTTEEPIILRPGYITRQMLEQVLHKVNEDSTMMRDDSGQAPKAPGMKYRHYAPKGDLTIVAGDTVHVVEYINTQIEQDRANYKKRVLLEPTQTYLNIVPMYAKVPEIEMMRKPLQKNSTEF